MRRLLYIFICFLFFAACKKEKGDIDIAPDTTPQTTLMYLAGTSLSIDNNTNFYEINIAAAKKAIAKNALGYSRFLIFKQISRTKGSLIEYKYSKGKCIEETVAIYDNIKSFTQDAIMQVVSDTKEHAPADNYNLIISGHGTAWAPKGSEDTWSRAVATNITHDDSSLSNIDWDAMSNSPVVTRYMGSSMDGLFDISEISSSLEATQTHFQCIIFDACFMSSIETLYELRSNSDYIIASPCEILGDGFPYETTLPYLYVNKGKDINIEGICNAFYSYYSTFHFPSGCIAATVTSEIENLAAITKEINSQYSDEEVDVNTLQAYERLKDHLFFDFEQYMLAKCKDQRLATEFKEQMELTFPSQYRFHTDRFFANIGVYASSNNNYEAYYTAINYYSGVTTSAPSSRLSSEWEQTSWAIATN